MLYHSIYIITYLFNTVSIENFMAAIFGKSKLSKPITFAVYLLYPAIVCSVFFLINIPLVNLASNIVALFLITLIYPVGMAKRLLSTVFLYLFMFGIEAAVVFATGYIGISVTEQGQYAQILGLLLIALVMYFISLAFRKFKSMQQGDRVRPTEWMAILLIPVCSVFLIAILGAQVFDRVSGVVAVIAIFSVNVIVFRLYESLMQAHKNHMEALVFQQEKEYYLHQCRYMEASQNEVRSLRHDMKNHLLVIQDYIHNGSSQEATKYIETIAAQRLSVKQAYSDTGNLAIDSVLNCKLSEAELYHVRLQTEISIPQNLLLDASMITTILGNLLDNAIQATARLPEIDREISLAVSYDRGRLFLEVVNSFDGIVVQKNGHFQTRKKTAESHGYGLFNIEKALEQYNGVLECHYDEHFFTASAILYVKAAVTA